MKLLPSYRTASVPQQKTWRQVDLTWFDVDRLEKLKSTQVCWLGCHHFAQAISPWEI